MRRPRRGFTLVEVLVALAVMAIALTAIFRALGQSIDLSAELRDRTLALWIAQDTVALHRMDAATAACRHARRRPNGRRPPVDGDGEGGGRDAGRAPPRDRRRAGGERPHAGAARVVPGIVMRKTFARHRRGFTLIEVLVALSVFGVVSALAYTALARALEKKDRLDRERAFWSQMTLAFVRIDQDLSEARARGGSAGDGAPLPAMAGKSGGDRASVEFTRAATPGLGARALQRVGYEMSDHTLWRVTWPAVDRAPNARPTRSALIENVDGFSLRFHGAGSVGDVWPTSAVADLLPRGLEMTLTIPGRGAFSRAFFIHD